MPGEMELINKATQELFSKVQGQASAALKRLEPVKSTKVLRALTPEQIRENLEFEEYEKAKSLDNNDKLRTALTRWNIENTNRIPELMNGNFGVIFDGRNDLRRSANEAGLPGDIFDKIIYNPHIIQSFLRAPLDNVDYVNALDHPESKQASIVRSLASASPEEIKRYKEAKSIAGSDDLEEYFTTRYGHYAPSELEKAINESQTLMRYGQNPLEFPTQLPELRSRLGFDPNLPVSAEKLLSLPGHRNVAKLIEDISRHPEAHNPDVLRRLVGEKRGDIEKGVLGELLQHLEPREAALAAKEIVRPHYPIEETTSSIPVVYKGKRLAEFQPSQLEALKTAENMAGQAKEHAGRSRSEYEALANELMGKRNIHSNIYKNTPKISNQYKKPYVDFDQILKQDDIEDPTYKRYLQQGEHEANAIERKMKEIYGDRQNATAGALASRGALGSSAARLANDALKRRHAEDIVEARQRLIDKYSQLGQAAVNAKRGHQFNVAHNLSNALERYDQGIERRAEMEHKAEALDRDNAIRAQGVSDVGRQQNLSMLENARRAQEYKGDREQDEEQKRLNELKMQHAEELAAPMNEAARILAVTRGAVPAPVHMSTYVPPVSLRPNNQAMNSAIMQNTAGQLKDYFSAFGAPQTQQQASGMQQQLARGGVILRRAEGGSISANDLLSAYNNQLNAYQHALQMRKQKQPSASDVAWQGVGDQAAHAALAGARKQSPMEGFGNALATTNNRYSEHRKALAQKEKDDMDFEKSLTDAYGDRYKHVSTAEENRADREARREHDKEMLEYHNRELGEMARHHKATEESWKEKAEAKKAERTPKQQAEIDKSRQVIADAMDMMARARGLEVMSDYAYTGPYAGAIPGSAVGILKSGSAVNDIFDQESNALVMDKFQALKSMGPKGAAILRAMESSKVSKKRTPQANIGSTKGIDTEGRKAIQLAIDHAKSYGATPEELNHDLEVGEVMGDERLGNMLNTLEGALSGSDKEKFESRREKALGGWKERTKTLNDFAIGLKKKNEKLNEGLTERLLSAPLEQQNERSNGLIAAAKNPTDEREEIVAVSPAGPSDVPPSSDDEGFGLKDVGNAAKRFVVDASFAAPELAAFVGNVPQHIGKWTGLADENAEPWFGQRAAKGRKAAEADLQYKHPESSSGKIIHDAIGAAGSMLGTGVPGLGLIKGAEKVATVAPKVAKGLGGTGKFLGGESIASALAGNTKEISKLMGMGAAVGGGESFLRNELDVTNPIASSVIAGVGVPLGLAAARKGKHGLARALGKEEVSLAEKQMEENIVNNITGGDKTRLDPYIEALEKSKSPLEGYQPTTAEHLVLSGINNPNINAMEQMRSRSSASPELGLMKAESAQQIPREIQALKPQGVDSSELRHALSAGHAKDLSDVERAVSKATGNQAHTYESASEKVRGGMGQIWLDKMAERKKISEPLYEEIKKVKELVPLNRFSERLKKYHHEGEQIINEKDLKVIEDALVSAGYGPMGEMKKARGLDIKAAKKNYEHSMGSGTFEKLDKDARERYLKGFFGEEAVNQANQTNKSVGSHLSVLRGELQDRVKGAYESGDARRRRVLNSFLKELDEDMADSIPASSKAKMAYRKLSEPINAIMEDPMINKIMDKSFYGNYHTASEAKTVDHFLKGKDSKEAARKLIDIAGKNNPLIEALRDRGRQYAAEALEKGANAKTIKNFEKSHPGVFELAPNLRTELSNVAKQNEKLTKRYGRTAKGEDELTRYSEGKDIVRKILSAKDKPGAAKDILERVKQYDKKNGDGLTAAVIDHIMDTQKGAKDTITPFAYTSYMKTYRKSLKEMLPPEVMEKLERIDKVMSGRLRVDQQTGSPGTQTQPFMAKAKELIEDAPRSAMTQVGDVIVDYVLGKTIGHFWNPIKELSKSRHSNRAATMDKILMDPAHAAKVFKRSKARGEYKEGKTKIPYNVILGLVSKENTERD